MADPSLIPGLERSPAEGNGNPLQYPYYDIEWFDLEMNTGHSLVFEIASKYCISESFADYDGYSISSKGFLPTVVDIMVT